MPLTVRPLTAADHRRWDEFVERQPDGTFFHLAGWSTVIERAFGHRPHYLLAEVDGKIEGVLPLAHQRSRLFGNALISTPFCVYGGAVVRGPEALTALLGEASSLARRLAVDYLELRNLTAGQVSWPTKSLYATFRKELLPTEAANLAAIPRKQRAMVRKGIAAGLRSEVDAGTERFYAAYSQSVRNLGTPVFARSFFDILQRVFGSSQC